jgi:hypothetical protein
MIFAAPIALPATASDAPPVVDVAPAPIVLASVVTPNPPPRGWLGIGGRNAFGLSGPATLDFGANMFGGLWMLNEHMQPIVLAGWSRGASNGLVVDAFRFGGELALGGAFLGEHLWLGGTVGLGGESVWGHRDSSSSARWAAVFSTSGLAEVRVARRFLIGVEGGPEVATPTVHFVGPSGPAPWSPFRLNAGLRLGVLL